MYCEWDRYCQQVLVERMEDGSIERAPIHADIKSLRMPDCLAPKMIGGGFPCQDISSMGLMGGIVHSQRSSMFFEIMRIVDETPSIDYIFLENVSNILKCGLKEVVAELVKREFNLQWTVKTAGSLGAPHQRGRRFCLAVRRGAPPLQVIPDDAASAAEASSSEVPSSASPWAEETCPRVTFLPGVRADPSYDERWIQRCHIRRARRRARRVRGARARLAALARAGRRAAHLRRAQRRSRVPVRRRGGRLRGSLLPFSPRRSHV